MNGRDLDLLASIILEVWSTLVPRGFPGCTPRTTLQNVFDAVLVHPWFNLAFPCYRVQFLRHESLCNYDSIGPGCCT